MKNNTSELTQSWKCRPGLKRYALVFAAVLTLAIVVLTGCDSQEGEKIDLSQRIDDDELARITSSRDGDSLRFGFDLRSSPEEDARQYLPFLRYLEKATGLRIKLHFTPKNSDIMDLLGRDSIQFAAVGAGTYIKARERYGIVPLVQGLNAEGLAKYQSVIVVAPDSPIRKIEELRGKRFAFGSVTSTQGHLIPRISLAEHGILLDDLAGSAYTGSHRNCANAVIRGSFDAGGVQDILGRRMAEENLLRIIYTSKFYPSSCIVANRDVAPDVMEKVKQALLDFKPTGAHAEGLYNWERTEMANGFIEARDEDYAELRQWSIRFGLLDPSVRERAR